MFTPELQRAWTSCEAADPNQFETLPNGRYIVRIDSIRIDDARNVAGKMIPECLVYEMTITEGDFFNRRCRKMDYFNNDKALSYIKLDMNTLGCQIPVYLNDLSIALQKAVGMTVEIEVKHTTSSSGKEFVNTYIKRAVNILHANAQMQAQPQQPQQPQQPWRPAPQEQLDAYANMMTRQPNQPQQSASYPNAQASNLGPFQPVDDIPF